MLNYVRSNWLWFFIGLILMIIVIWLLGQYLSKVSIHPHDTFYYRVIDINGVESCNHDSGIRPSKTLEGSLIQLQILKSEYNDGKQTNLSVPSVIKMGIHYHDLKWELVPQKILDNETHYTVEIIAPKTLLCGLPIPNSIDSRKEIDNDSM